METGPADFVSDLSVWRCASLPGGNGRYPPVETVKPIDREEVIPTGWGRPIAAVRNGSAPVRGCHRPRAPPSLALVKRRWIAEFHSGLHPGTDLLGKNSGVEIIGKSSR